MRRACSAPRGPAEGGGDEREGRGGTAISAQARPSRRVGGRWQPARRSPHPPRGRVVGFGSPRDSALLPAPARRESPPAAGAARRRSGSCRSRPRRTRVGPRASTDRIAADRAPRDARLSPSPARPPVPRTSRGAAAPGRSRGSTTRVEGAVRLRPRSGGCARSTRRTARTWARAGGSPRPTAARAPWPRRRGARPCARDPRSAAARRGTRPPRAPARRRPETPWSERPGRRRHRRARASPSRGAKRRAAVVAAKNAASVPVRNVVSGLSSTAATPQAAAPRLERKISAASAGAAGSRRARRGPRVGRSARRCRRPRAPRQPDGEPVLPEHAERSGVQPVAEDGLLEEDERTSRGH